MSDKIKIIETVKTSFHIKFIVQIKKNTSYFKLTVNMFVCELGSSSIIMIKLR